MKAYCIALLFALVAIVTAQSNSSPFYITNPLPGTSLKAGDSVDITWNNGLDQSVKVIVIQGANANTMSPTGISFNVQGGDEHYQWTVPKSLAPTGTFAFQFQYTDDNGATQYSYSGPITVTGGTGTIGSATASASSSSSAVSSVSASTSAVTSSSSATSSAVSSASSSSVAPTSSSTSGSIKTSASATSTPTPNSATGLQITSFVLAIPALMMLALNA
ncbi:uncharacterized protein BX664DRAFT_324029 [Halteromyces radiatus]|uniref:uncharacterized protein n=1 Tax=Halteromyces radiatus TaxID=101107 RepID=UPI00221F261D|nr:uncharacterized protein BX664DRAFT_324029 [Halteromyces radiatus]KAI8096449.1 hypothetical protein BX664DRAFT_324029 [Halteromyces radiatus]